MVSDDNSGREPRFSLLNLLFFLFLFPPLSSLYVYLNIYSKALAPLVLKCTLDWPPFLTSPGPYTRDRGFRNLPTLVLLQQQRLMTFAEMKFELSSRQQISVDFGGLSLFERRLYSSCGSSGRNLFFFSSSSEK